MIRKITPLLLLACHGSFFGADAVVGQTPAAITSLSPPERIARGDRLHTELEPLPSLREYLAAAGDPGTRYEALWKSARAAISLGMLSEDEDAEGEWYRTAEGYAREATELHPERAKAREWLAIALGRLSLLEGPVSRARMAEAIREEALAAITADSLSSGAHQVLGTWHAEIMRASAIARFAARGILGASTLGEASWEAAEHHLREATRLAPDGMIHALELGRLLMERDRPEEAQAYLERVRDGVVLEPTDVLHQQEATALLEGKARRRRGR